MPTAQSADDFKIWMEEYKVIDDDILDEYLPRISSHGDKKMEHNTMDGDMKWSIM